MRTTFYEPDGRLSRESWTVQGIKHRDGGPAEVKYDESGKVIYETWHIDGKLHREDGPARTVARDGLYYTWCWNGKIHRKDGPAVQIMDLSNMPMIQIWYSHGLYHRIDGPIDDRYDDYFFVFGKRILNSRRYLTRRGLIQ